MSCTLAMDIPEAAVSFATRRSAKSREEMGSLFLTFLTERMGYMPEARENAFADFCGTWNDAQFEEFNAATRRTVNAEDWA